MRFGPEEKELQSPDQGNQQGICCHQSASPFLRTNEQEEALMFVRLYYVY